MTALSDTLEQLNHLYVRAPIRIRTLGQFSVWRNDTLLSSKNLVVIKPFSYCNTLFPIVPEMHFTKKRSWTFMGRLE